MRFRPYVTIKHKWEIIYGKSNDTITFVTLKDQIQGHSDFKVLYLRKEESWAMLLLNINMKAYKGSPMTSLDLTYFLVTT